MVMNQGVDAQVQNRVDAYRNNPQQLMRMYQQNQELVDLLALQKLKSEKEAAARQMQMQMQQQPGTIAQQREQEVLQLTKNELAQQTQGVLQRKQQQQQANLQRAAQGGIGALAQQRPAPVPAPQGQPMPRMASGGIVAFQPGGSVSNVTYEEWLRMSRSERERAGLPLSFLGGQDYFNRFGVGLGLNDPETGERIRREASPGSAGRGDRRDTAAPTQYVTAGSRTRAGLPALDPELLTDEAPRVAPAVAAARAAAEYDPASEDAVPVRYNPASEDAVPVGYNPASEDALGGTPTPPPAPATEAEAEATAVDPAPASAPSATRAGIASLGGGSMGGAEAALMRGVQIGEDVLGRGEKAARFAEMEAQLAALDEELFDPEAERRQQLQAFLIGTAGATNIGYAMAGGAAAAINLENRQKQNRRDRMLSRIQLGERGMTMDTEIGRQALALGNQMFADFNANVRTATQAAATLDAAQLRAATADADRAFNREKEANDQEYRMRDLEIREAANAAETARNEQLDIDRRVQGVLTATNDMLRLSAQVHERAAEMYDVQAATAALTITNPRDPDYPALLEARKTAVAEADAWAAQYLERRGVNDILTDLQQQYYTLTGVSGMPGINPDDILEIETEGE